MPCILKETGFKGTLLEILCTFYKGLDRVYKNLLHTPHDLSGGEYEVQACLYLGFQALQILQMLLLLLRRSSLMLATLLTRPFQMLILLVYH